MNKVILAATAFALCIGLMTASPADVTGVCYVGDEIYPDLATALTDCPANKTIVVSSDQSFPASQTISRAGVAIECVNTVAISWAQNATLTLNGADSGVRGCGMTGAGLAAPSVAAIRLHGANQSFIGNKVSGFAATGSSTHVGVVEVMTGNDTSNLRFLDNTFSGNAMWPLWARPSGNMQHWRITGNFLENGAGIVPQIGAIPHDITFANNQITVNSNGYTITSCFELLGGNVNIHSVSITGNNCRNYGTTTWLGQNAYAMGRYTKCAFSNNTYDSNGFNFGSNTYLVEMNGADDCVIGGNTITSLGGEDASIACESCRKTTIANNVINGFGTASYAAGIYLISTLSNQDASGNVVTGNTIAYLANALGTGIHVECMAAGSTCNDIVVANNALRNPNKTGGTSGVKIRNTGGSSIGGLLIGPNAIKGNDFGVLVGGGVVSLCYLPGASDANTAFHSYSAPSVCR